MRLERLFAGEGVRSKGVLACLATVLSAGGVLLLLGPLLLGKAGPTEVPANPLLVQTAAVVPDGAELLLRWEADRVKGEVTLTFDGRTVTEQAVGARGRVEGARLVEARPLPAGSVRWFVRPLSYVVWVRIAHAPAVAEGDSLRLRLESVHPVGGPCAFEIYTVEATGQEPVNG